MTKVINASKCIITLCVQGGCRYQSFLRGSCKAHTSAISEMLFSAILQHRLCDTSKKAGTVYSKKTDPVPLILHTQWSKDRKSVRNTPPKSVFRFLLLWPLSYSFGTNLQSTVSSILNCYPPITQSTDASSNRQLVCCIFPLIFHISL